MTLPALVHLLHLASPALPVGAFSYSQGMEAAAEAGWVHDRPSAQAWIAGVLAGSIACLEAPLWLRLHRAWRAGDATAASHWNAFFLASRESAELRAESVQMGYSLLRLLGDVDEFAQAGLDTLHAIAEPALPTVSAFAAAHWSIAERDGLTGYLWAWIENQTMAAIKIVPLGQTDGQRILLALGDVLPAHVERAQALPDEGLGALAHGLAMASSWHETQYTRIFRS